MFVSVEERAEVSLSQITESLWEKPLEAFWGPRKQGKRNLWSTPDLTGDWAEFEVWVEEVRKRRSMALNAFDPTTRDDPFAYVDLRAVEYLEFEHILGSFWHKIKVVEGVDVLVVIDSLSALIHWARHAMPNYDERQMLLAILRSFEKWRGLRRFHPTVIFTSEDRTVARGEAAESYIADVVIQLQREGKTYKIPAPPGGLVEWEDDLLFCRILKGGRGLAIQPAVLLRVRQVQGSRTVPHLRLPGPRLTVPRDEPQLQEIQDFRTVDVPSTYPGVVVQEFTRSGMQRFFAVSAMRNKSRAVTHCSYQTSMSTGS